MTDFSGTTVLPPNLTNNQTNPTIRWAAPSEDTVSFIISLAKGGPTDPPGGYIFTTIASDNNYSTEEAQDGTAGDLGDMKKYKCTIGVDLGDTLTENTDHRFTIQAVDSSGNVSFENSYTWVSDFTSPNAPDVFLITPRNENIPIWQWTMSSDTHFYRHRLNGGDWSAEQERVFGLNAVNQWSPLTSLQDGDYTFEVQAKDLAGNWSEIGSSSVNIDTVPPTPTISGLAGVTLEVGNNVELTIGGTDVLSYSYILFINGSQPPVFGGVMGEDPIPVATKLTINFDVEGTYVLVMGGHDSAGNTGNLFGGTNVTSLTWTVNHPKPEWHPIPSTWHSGEGNTIHIQGINNWVVWPDMANPGDIFIQNANDPVTGINTDADLLIFDPNSNSGCIKTNTPFDYENPIDSNLDNRYQFELVARHNFPGGSTTEVKSMELVVGNSTLDD